MAESRSPLANLSDAELEQALRDLGRRFTFPATPDIAGRVRAQIMETSPRPKPLPAHRWRRIWLAAAIALLAIAATLALSPDVRTAIAERLGLRGVLLQWIDETPAPPPAPVGARLMLGRQITLDEARDAVDFPLLLPTAPGFTDPPEVYRSGQGPDAMVSYVYPPASALPATGDSGVGALLTQFRGDAERNLIEKGLHADDGEMGATLEVVSIAGKPGFWISGAPHAFYLVCPDVGECREERYRLAGNVLLWNTGEVTLRLESALTRDEAVAVAASVQAMD